MGIPILSDVPIVGPAVDEALDVVTSVFDRVPGSEWIKKAVEDGATWLGEMAKTPGGQFILQAITNTYFFPGIANIAIPGSVSGMQVVGPQVASLVWAIPGMTAGKRFTEAYTQEVTIRVIKLIAFLAGHPELMAAGLGIAGPELDSYLKLATADFLGSIDVLVKDAGFQEALAELNRFIGSQSFRDMIAQIEKDPDFKKALQNIKALDVNLDFREALRQTHLTPHELAKKYGIRADAAAAALNASLQDYCRGCMVYNLDGEFNIADGSPTAAHFELTPVPKRTFEQGLVDIYPDSNKVSQHLYASLPRNDPRNIVLQNRFPPFVVRRERTHPTILGSGTFVSQNPSGGILKQLLLAALLTSPAWIPIFVLPAMQGKKS